MASPSTRPLASMAALLLLGCGSIGSGAQPVEVSTAPEPEAEPFRPMLVLPLPQLGKEERKGTRLETLSGRDSSIQDVLLSLFKDSDINLLVDPDVQGSATFDVKGSTVEHAFETLLRTLDLTYEWDGEFLRVRARQREMFYVDLLGQEQSQGTTGTSSVGLGGGDQSSANSGESLWDLIAEDLEKISGGQASLLVNRMAGTVEVEGSPSVVRRMRSYLHHVLKRLTAQVSIEARLLEVSLKDEYRLGIDWSLLPGFFGSSKAGTLAGGAMLAQSLRSGGTALNLGVLKPDHWSIFVDALEKQGQVRILSSPRVSTMNNQPAEIRIARNIPVLDREVIDAGGGPRTEYTVRFVEAGVSVVVVPQVGEDGMLTVAVSPRVVEQTDTFTSPDGQITEPILDSRETTTRVRVADGQTIVLGGLRTTRKNETVEGVPVLKDIPLLGYLFRKQVQNVDEIELMFTLIPRVLDQAWIKEEHRRGRDRLLLTKRPFTWSPLDLEGHVDEEWDHGLLEGKPSHGDRPDVRIHELPTGELPRRSQSLTVTRGGLADLQARRAEQSWLQGELADAIDQCAEVATMDPARTDALVFGSMLLVQERRFVEARRWLDRALVAAPRSPQVLAARGAVEFHVGTPQAAVKLLSHAYLLEPTVYRANNLAAALLASGETAQAKDLLEEHRKDPEAPPEVHANLAWILCEEGDLTGAEAQLERGLGYGLDRRDPRVRALFARIETAKAEAAAAKEPR